MEDPLESRFDRIDNFLKINGAGRFAQLLYNVPVLYRTAMDNRLSMIIAPSDERLQKLTIDIGKSLAEMSQTEAGRNLLSNHLSVVHTKTVNPMFTAINVVTYGSSVDDLMALEVITSTMVDGVKILITPHLIGYEEQLIKNQRLYDPGIFGGMTRDTFRSLINNGNLRGRDLISLCRTNDYVNENFCNYRDASGKTIFHYLVKEEFGLDVRENENARTKYGELHRKLEVQNYPTVGILVDNGPDWNSRGRPTRYRMNISRKFAQQAPTLRADGTVSRKAMDDNTAPIALKVNDLIYVLWNHPINLYLLVSVYNPTASNEPYRVSLARLVKDPQGDFVYTENGERFSLAVDRLKQNLIQTVPIQLNEVPVAQRVVHYTNPYPETLPFLYNLKIREYNKAKLLTLIMDLYTTATMHNAASDVIFGSKDINFTTIPDFIRGPLHPRRLTKAINQSLNNLAIKIVNNDFAEEEHEMILGFNRNGPAVAVRVNFRFHEAYNLLIKSLIVYILQLLLLFSGAVNDEIL